MTVLSQSNPASKGEKTQINSSPNVVSLNDWKVQKERFKELKSYCKYLSILHPIDLMNEVRFLIEKTRSQGQNPELLHRGKILLDELSKRVATTSPKMGQMIEKLKFNLDKLN